jgi:signal transduction histidine kinase
VTAADLLDVAALGEHVAVLAPFGRDAEVVSAVLLEAGIHTSRARDMGQLLGELRQGRGAALLTEEALAPVSLSALLRLLEEQPPWSDLPILLLLAQSDGVRPAEAARLLSELTVTPNVTALERPIAAITLVTAVQSALRARRRQYEVRDLLARERAAREQAEEATRMKDEFLASVSHELRTPLSAILLWAQLLEAGRLSAEQAGHAARSIVSGAGAQSRLIEDLLDVSRMLTGKLQVELTARELEPILLQAVQVVQPMADAKGVSVEVRVPRAGALALLDAERAQQIFWNLLSNAVKFTPKGGRVQLSLAREPQHLCVVVKDTGQGIPPELLPHVFERFRQGDVAFQRRGGLGLGLSIVQHLVECHGGVVRASSEGEGRGATFTVRLPIADVKNGQAHAPHAWTG